MLSPTSSVFWLRVVVLGNAVNLLNLHQWRLTREVHHLRLMMCIHCSTNHCKLQLLQALVLTGLSSHFLLWPFADMAYRAIRYWHGWNLTLCHLREAG